MCMTSMLEALCSCACFSSRIVGSYLDTHSLVYVLFMQVADSSTWWSPGVGRHQWYRQIHCPQDPGRQAETQPGQVFCKWPTLIHDIGSSFSYVCLFSVFVFFLLLHWSRTSVVGFVVTSRFFLICVKLHGDYLWRNMLTSALCSFVSEWSACICNSSKEKYACIWSYFLFFFFFLRTWN